MLKAIIKTTIVLLLVWWAVCIIYTIAVSSTRPRNPISASVACINNLRQIDAAAHEFALEHSLTNGAPINFPDDLTPYMKLTSNNKIPTCPAGGIFNITCVGEKPTCSLGTTVTPAHIFE